MPCRSELTKSLGATCSLVDASHVLTMTYPSAGYKAVRQHANTTVGPSTWHRRWARKVGECPRST
jgi:hypothetical protein